MRESKVEKYLREQVELRGGMCEKFVSPNKVGVPDRLITWPRCMHLAETKATGDKPNTTQARDHKRRKKYGITVWVLASKEQVDAYLAHVDMCTVHYKRIPL